MTPACLVGLMVLVPSPSASAQERRLPEVDAFSPPAARAAEGDRRSAATMKRAGMVTTTVGVVGLAGGGALLGVASSEESLGMIPYLFAAGAVGGLGVICFGVGLPLWVVGASDEAAAERRLELHATPGGAAVSGAF